MAPSDLSDMDLLDQVRLVRAREASAAEVVEAAIARIESANPAVNAVVLRLYDEARASVRDAGPDGPLAGAPFLIKDLFCHYRGTPTSAASPLLAGRVVDHDSELMARYRRAGLVTLGKTNLCEFGTLGTTEPKLFGPTRNPWDLERSSGGSSGGAGAAVAAGMVPAAHGGDGAGSIRIPASCCGVFGLKPTRGRITLGPDLGEGLAGMVNEHVLSMTVRDSAALLDATHGPMPGDPYSAAAPQETFLSQVDRPPGRLRIALTDRSLIGTPLHPDCAAAVRETARLCADLGHVVEEAAPDFDGARYNELYRRFWPLTVTRSLWALGQTLGRRPQDLAAEVEPFNRYLFERGSRVLAADYLVDLGFFHGVSRSIGRFLQRYDAWLTPTLGTPPPLLGHFDAGRHGGEAVMDRFMDFLAFTTFANMAGLPAMTVPLAWNGEGLPVGSQFNGRAGDEATLFRLAAQLEQAKPWRGRRPKVWAGDRPPGEGKRSTEEEAVTTTSSR